MLLYITMIHNTHGACVHRGINHLGYNNGHRLIGLVYTARKGNKK